ncbi:MAG: nucleotidyltransferase domain-containing protein [Bacteroidetes bacterium]|nr:nucleotidyltransferase domain-containing protein [Bacteroidota bacterium]
MVTRKTIISKTSQFIEELRNEGIDPVRVFLFGSYAKGTCNDHSDIDIAIWAKGFSGIRSLDIEIISHLLKKYKLFEMHTFSEVLDLDDPYQQEIILSGIDLANEIPITA